MSSPDFVAGRELHTQSARIAGVVSCVPSQQVDNDHFAERFDASAVRDVVKMIGVNRRRWADAQTSAGDLCRKAGETLLAGLGWQADSIDALIFVSQTPDYRLPGTAFALQADLGLPVSCLALDINLGCSGYPQALWLGMNLIQTGAAKRVLLAVGDTISKLVDPADRSTALLFGDAGTMTALEASAGDAPAHFIIGADGRGVRNLIVPAGGFKPYDTTADERMAGKSAECLFMDGGEIFNFTLNAVPKLVARTLEIAGRDKATYDAFLFHQANLFMLKHLSKKAGLPAERVPTNIGEYGNTSCASIPLLMTTELKNRLKEEALHLGMFGFGVGYSWASAALQVGPLAIVDTIET
ncbi:ketoacyl-ACP synthase III [Paraburkholderia phenoliruptrix]|uniref:3-oxoacyl-[acyl-carrier-protein] synthase 3 n=2 Tax=Paraburkholderia phenoliruptrix TaxID=252970 RepID=A0A6J5B7Z6_9BURK|nr:ketoacyl-ACP synthase III [Paraburkholderia phenoliruptrix]AFT87522.1 Beta-ketoacyl-ACP synthase III [Paraburkholderia phenoliruptrix BR3459a]CAB3695530.1 3-oxoacyl-[acyl-carrier-protein] synthase 3 [Paraburkholderia phenoliruptrix]CAB4051043.1 3-oxoacyl-[acyl-carrier-protein] synthase 3 [Paraburkholderia phenoliruptrix]